MPTQAIRDLRQRYRTTSTTYLGCVRAISKVGRPTSDVLDAEKRTLAELVAARDAFVLKLAAYYSCCQLFLTSATTKVRAMPSRPVFRPLSPSRATRAVGRALPLAA